MAKEEQGAVIEEKPAEGNTAEQKHGICPHCGADRKGLVWDFFSNVMTVAGKVCQVAYSTCSCAECGKILATSIMGMAEANIQPSPSAGLGVGVVHGWPSSRRHRQ